MTDRKLLELAAKAAGYTSHGFAEMACGSPCLFLREADFTGMWAPLTDDGDALRLAVKLASLSKGARFEVSVRAMYDGRGFASAGFFSRDNPSESAVEADLGAATRRAIVRAAAEIGKAMK